MPNENPTVVTGNFPVNEVSVEIDTSSVTSRSASNQSFAVIKDLESANFSIETSLETWQPFDTKGWQRALATAKSISFSMSGKRNFGDTGNDYVAGKWLCNGQACNSTLKLTFPDSSVFLIPVVIQVTNPGGGDSTNVMPLEFDLASDGKPTEQAAS
ncbi:MAG: hypothetical protein IJU45_05915 [Clostridia bacterium]|nr:hypothetical protein [Clostridia bacterium]